MRSSSVLVILLWTTEGGLAATLGTGVTLASGDVTWQGLELKYEMLAGIPHQPGTGKFSVNLASNSVPLLPPEFSLQPVSTLPSGSLLVQASVILQAGGDDPVYGWLNQNTEKISPGFSYLNEIYYRPQAGSLSDLGTFTPLEWSAYPKLTTSLTPGPSGTNPLLTWRIDFFGTIPKTSAPDFAKLVTPEPAPFFGLLAGLAIFFRPCRRP